MKKLPYESIDFYVDGEKEDSYISIDISSNGRAYIVCVDESGSKASIPLKDNKITQIRDFLNFALPETKQ